MTVFLSYDRRDEPLANRLEMCLEGRGFEVLSQRFSLLPGQRWQDETRQAIDRAAAVLLLLGPDAQRGDWQDLEIRTALEAAWNDPEKRLIPVLHGGATPPHFLHSVYPLGQLEAIVLEDGTQAALAAAAIEELLAGRERSRRERVTFSWDQQEDRAAFRESLEEIKAYAASLRRSA